MVTEENSTESEDGRPPSWHLNTGHPDEGNICWLFLVMEPDFAGMLANRSDFYSFLFRWFFFNKDYGNNATDIISNTQWIERDVKKAVVIWSGETEVNHEHLTKDTSLTRGLNLGPSENEAGMPTTASHILIRNNFDSIHPSNMWSIFYLSVNFYFICIFLNNKFIGSH
jgi:hypothetical protein